MLQSQIELILKSLKFVNLINKEGNCHDINLYCKNVLFAELNPKSIICNVNEKVKLIYIIESGKVIVDECEIDNAYYRVNQELSVGDVIYTDKITYNMKLKTLEKTDLICINISEFKALREHCKQNLKVKINKFITDSTYFSKLHFLIVYINNNRRYN